MCVVVWVLCELVRREWAAGGAHASMECGVGAEEGRLPSGQFTRLSVPLFLSPASLSNSLSSLPVRSHSA